jgi:hypothetical protein
VRVVDVSSRGSIRKFDWFFSKKGPTIDPAQTGKAVNLLSQSARVERASLGTF